ncbi:hypothetical protein FQR65_LT19751 [Abscondita terminalis]|nr:hypothetical protein FQR65_LT19751 [Abscondita terminalis]
MERLMDPPQETSMWRFGFLLNPVNYNDNEIILRRMRSEQWEQNNCGKCGICRDPVSGGGASPHEAGRSLRQRNINKTLCVGPRNRH